MSTAVEVRLTLAENPCHKGQSQRSGPCPGTYSGACPCVRPGGHSGRCRCGVCGRRFIGHIDAPAETDAILHAGTPVKITLQVPDIDLADEALAVARVFANDHPKPRWKSAGVDAGLPYTWAGNHYRAWWSKARTLTVRWQKPGPWDRTTAAIAARLAREDGVCTGCQGTGKFWNGKRLVGTCAFCNGRGRL